MTQELLFIITLVAFTWIVKQLFTRKGIAVFYETEGRDCCKFIAGFSSYASLTSEALQDLNEKYENLTIKKIQKI